MDWLFEELVNSLNERVEFQMDALSRGCADDYAGYAGLVGRITGVRESISIIKEMQEKINKQEDEE